MVMDKQLNTVTCQYFPNRSRESIQFLFES